MAARQSIVLERCPAPAIVQSQPTEYGGGGANLFDIQQAQQQLPTIQQGATNLPIMGLDPWFKIGNGSGEFTLLMNILNLKHLFNLSSIPTFRRLPSSLILEHSGSSSSSAIFSLRLFCSSYGRSTHCQHSFHSRSLLTASFTLHRC
jgi:hypothetical protein